ncbi:class I SAM-dependent methyltransferase [Lichenicoccus sp.]|uniref:class I SAM-dependent methyltransferase n=1 Tax=Lichenicoccus sp. TaxID=2781899 RepID=UPI003D14B344
MSGYVHGYDGREAARLEDQARTLEELLHAGSCFPHGSAVLEAGCGTGAQTVALARRSPGAHIVAMDISAESLAKARARVSAAGLCNVELQQADLLAAPFAPASFDHIFLCFVLEHLPDPAAALASLRALLRSGGTITVIEGDHASTCLHPESTVARAAISCQVELQRRAGGDAMIGRSLFPLLAGAGFTAVHASPRLVYVDGSTPELADGFIRNTFIAMVAGVREPAIAAGLTTPKSFDAGIRALHRAAEPDGVFCYTFFKATGRVM